MKLAKIALLVLGLGIAGTATAGWFSGKVPPVNADKSGVALHGYDAVSYLEAQAPQKGSQQFATTWKGATWLFVSAENRTKFTKTPEAYAPQFGGYCAKAVSENNTADIDPLAYKIVNGKLYLNYDAKIQKIWEQDIPGRIANAEKYWPNLHLAP